MEHKGKRILVVDDDPENIKLLTEYLVREGHSVASASDGTAALHRVKAWKPHLIFLDVNLPGITGYELVPKLRAACLDEYVSIVLVSANMTIEDVLKGLDSGADDYLTKPVRSQEVLSRVRVALHVKETHDSLRRALAKSEELAASDDLTGLLNARAFFRKAESEILRARRFKKPVSLLMIDLDDFAAVNEGADFAFGSEVLREVAGRMRQCVRSIDLLARVGADEFLLLLVETDLAGAEFMAERIRESIQSGEIRRDRHSVKLTASIGIAGLSYQHEREENQYHLYRNASEALGTAKHCGPSSIEIYSSA